PLIFLKSYGFTVLLVSGGSRGGGRPKRRSGISTYKFGHHIHQSGHLILQILVLILNVLALVLRTLTLALHIPQDCIVSLDIAFEVSLRHSLCLRNRSWVNRSLIYLRSMKLTLIERRWVEIRLVEISSSVLIKIVSPIEIVLVILMGKKTGRSDLVSNHLRLKTGVSLIVICGGCLRHILLNVVSISIFVGSGTILVCVGTTASYTV
nr:hypothetical protein [Tanacetum cinerariifolium]